MSSDADYASFLDKANQDTGSSEAKAQTSSKKQSIKTVTTSSVPSQLKDLDEYYVSEADEPFEPVSLSFDGKTLDSKSFKSTISADEVEELSLKDFDPQSQYKTVLDTVRGVVDGESEIKVFRVESGKARVEYWVVGLKDGVLLGVRAKAVES